MNIFKKKYVIIGSCISMISLIIAGVHLKWPNLSIDGITLALLVVGLLPWMAPLIKSIEVPGLKVELSELTKIEFKARNSGLINNKIGPETESLYPDHGMDNGDPNIVLAALRIDIERRLRRLAMRAGVSILEARGMNSIVNALFQNKIISQQEASLYKDLASILNRAVHGADVDSQAAKWATTVGAEIIKSLDNRL